MSYHKVLRSCYVSQQRRMQASPVSQRDHLGILSVCSAPTLSTRMSCRTADYGSPSTLTFPCKSNYLCRGSFRWENPTKQHLLYETEDRARVLGQQSVRGARSNSLTPWEFNAFGYMHQSSGLQHSNNVLHRAFAQTTGQATRVGLFPARRSKTPEAAG